MSFPPAGWHGRPGRDRDTMSGGLASLAVKTTMIYTHVLNRGGLSVRSPADFVPSNPTAAAGR